TNPMSQDIVPQAIERPRNGLLVKLRHFEWISSYRGGWTVLAIVGSRTLSMYCIKW
ncbi:hypothetical protein Y032_0824g2544, partial [Ancylostoma ceylanicum]